MDHPTYVVLVPVKRPIHAKSRLGDLDERRVRLATAFALDTVRAALTAARVDRVLAVGDDHALAAGLRDLGAEALPDGVSDDLNQTLRLAAAEARRRWPGLRPAAVLADLPALRPGELDAALEAAASHDRAFVPDAEGVGTTLYTASHRRFAPRFGPGSAAAHRDSAAIEVGVDLTSLRRDVDDRDDLVDAARLGVGPHTAAVLAAEA